MAESSLTGRVALVTGGAIRVGAAIVRALADAGMRVAVHYASSSSAADAIVSDLRARGVDADVFQADLRDAATPRALVESVIARYGALHLLVNSAATMDRAEFGSITSEAWDATMSLNLRAPFFLAQAAAPHLARDEGAIVNIADLAAFETWPSYVPHGVSKAGIVQMTRALARVLAPSVRVNAVAPGAVLLPGAWDDDTAERFAKTTPLARLGEPDDVADAVLYLVRARYVTGETILVDGGRHIRA